MDQRGTDPFFMTTGQVSPVEFVAVPTADAPLCPEHFRDKILVHTVHDGDVIPQWVMDAPETQGLQASGELWRRYCSERDWGADLVAHQLAASLGLGGFLRVTTARVVMDFNRFPGSSPPDATDIERLAIIQPFSQLFAHDQKRLILERYYDAISKGMEEELEGKLLFVSIHTYDEHNRSMTQRPHISLLTRALSYQTNSHLPYNTFDPLFPDILVESSADRLLRDRLALTLEKSGFTVEHNYPYCLPDGSLEIRSQPWLFFREVRRRFLERFPQTEMDPAFGMVWQMLLNTNLRRSEAEALSGYLHRFRDAPGGREAEFRAAQKAYEKIAAFLAGEPRLVPEYRNSPTRTSALGVEVRKDLVYEFKGTAPLAPRREAARRIAEQLARGIAEYFVKDRTTPASAEALDRDQMIAC